MNYLFKLLQFLIDLFTLLAELTGSLYKFSFKFYLWFIYVLTGYVCIVTIMRDDYIMTILFMIFGLVSGIIYPRFLKYAGIDL